jgi:hypothetical protein
MYRGGGIAFIVATEGVTWIDDQGAEDQQGSQRYQQDPSAYAVTRIE